MGFLIAIIIILILILIIIIALYRAYRHFSQKVRQFSVAAFGTPSISQGAEQMRHQISTTPKSVSCMTNLLLPKITKDFPEFHYDEMKERANNVLTSYLRAVNDRNTSVLQDGNEELANQLENHIRMLSTKGLHEHFERIHIHRTEINQYRQTEGRCIITFQSAVECYHYTTDPDDRVIDGSKDNKYQAKYNTDLIYIQDRNLIKNELDNALGVNCPNCGAPVSSLNAKFCEYCGTGIVELNIKAWSFSNVEEIK